MEMKQWQFDCGPMDRRFNWCHRRRGAAQAGRVRAVREGRDFEC
jgi:hypothetical protein